MWKFGSLGSSFPGNVGVWKEILSFKTQPLFETCENCFEVYKRCLFAITVWVLWKIFEHVKVCEICLNLENCFKVCISLYTVEPPIFAHIQLILVRFFTFQKIFWRCWYHLKLVFFMVNFTVEKCSVWSILMKPWL